MAGKGPSKGSLAAKKMVTGMKNVWEFTKRDFTANAPQVKQELMDMVDFARNKTQMLRRPNIPGPSEITTQLERSVNTDVGGELLTQYKEDWSAIHVQTQSSGEEAAKLDAEIAQICNAFSQSHMFVQRCHDEFSQLPETITAIEEVQNKVNSLGEMLQKVEESITECARVKSQLESERKQHSIRIQYEKHCVEEDGKMEQLKNILMLERQKTSNQKEQHAAKQLEDRQKTFQSMFDEQMAEYREKGSVERVIIGEETRERAESTLEEVMIEDKNGSASLDEFLSDVIIDETDKASPTLEEEETRDKEEV